MFKNEALMAEKKHRTSVEEAQEYIENFDILETINNVGNDEVFTPVKVCQQILDILPDEVWTNPNYKWLNPSDKNGVFHREIAIRLDEGLKDWEPDEEKRKKHILQNMLFSIGLTKFTSQVSRRTLYYCSDANRSFDGKRDSHGHSINGYAIGDGSWFDNPEGNIKTPSTTHKFVKGRCKYCGTREKSRDGSPGRYSDPKQLEHYAYEFIHVDNIEKHLQKRFFGGENMKFYIIVGNPPYQLSDGGSGASAKPIYNLFVEQAIRLNPKYLTMIIPSRWMSGGKGLDSFRNNMISSNKISVLHDFPDHKQCFPQANIPGGVCYFMWQFNYKGKTKIYRHDGNNIYHSNRYLKEKGISIFIREEKQLDIVNKVNELKEEKISKIISPLKPYGLRVDFFKDPKKYKLPPINGKPLNNGIIIHGVIDGKREKRYVLQEYPIPKLFSDLTDWKIFINRADGAAGYIGNPKPARILGTPILAKPYEIATESFIQIGSFKTEKEAKNLLSYMRTKFFRFIVGVKKISQDMPSRVYELVPIQEFNKSWTDEELYKKYNLSHDEISYIDELIDSISW